MKTLKDLKITDVRYCTHLGRNVIVVSVPASEERRIECLNKGECGFERDGCRNRLPPFRC